MNRLSANSHLYHGDHSQTLSGPHAHVRTFLRSGAMDSTAGARDCAEPII